MRLDEYHRQGRHAASQRNREALRLASSQAGFLPTKSDRLRYSLVTLEKYHIKTWALLGILSGGCIAVAASSPWSIGLTVRHFMAANNCATARAVGLAPAVRGAPGYWARNDADDDGIACEPWPPSRWAR